MFDLGNCLDASTLVACHPEGVTTVPLMARLATTVGTPMLGTIKAQSLVSLRCFATLLTNHNVVLGVPKLVSSHLTTVTPLSLMRSLPTPMEGSNPRQGLSTTHPVAEQASTSSSVVARVSNTHHSIAGGKILPKPRRSMQGTLGVVDSLGIGLNVFPSSERVLHDVREFNLKSRWYSSSQRVRLS